MGDAGQSEFDAHHPDLQGLHPEANALLDLLHSCLARNPGAMCIKDAENGCRYLYLNRRYAELVGRLSADCLGRTDYELWPPELAAAIGEQDRAALASGLPLESSDTFPCRGGVRSWTSYRFPFRTVSGRLLLGCYAVDAAMETLEEVSSPLRSRMLRLMDSNIIGVACGEEERIIEANDLFLHMLGYTQEDLAAGTLSWESLTAPEFRGVDEAAWKELGCTGHFGPKDKECVRKDGSRIPVCVGGTVLERAPKPTWALYVLDMTEQKRLERRLQRAQAWQSLGIMAGGLAHDFNNLLVVIIGNASMALADPSPSPNVRSHLREVMGAAEQLAGLVRQLLAYSGKARFTLVHVRIAELIGEVCDAEAHPPGVHVSREIPPGLPSVAGDAAQLREALRSLLANALEAVGQSGRVRVSARLDRRDKPFPCHDAELAPGSYVTVRVEDSGPGIPPELHARIFDPFFSTKFTGRGLGLAAASGIVRRHGGGIRVESAPGAGARFEVLLPVLPENAPHMGAAPAPRQSTL